MDGGEDEGGEVVMFGEQQRLPGVTGSPPGPLPLPGDAGSVSQTKHPQSRLTEYVSGYFREPGERQDGQITPLPWKLRRGGSPRGRRRGFVLVWFYFIELLFQNKRISGLGERSSKEMLGREIFLFGWGFF